MIESVPVKSKLKKGIQQISFSPSGNVFVAVAIDVDHSIGIFDTNTGKQLHMLKGDTAVITDIEMRTEDEFATAGVKHFKVWTIVNGSAPTSKKGVFGTGENRYSDICTCLS